MMQRLSRTFPSVKHPNPKFPKISSFPRSLPIKSEETTSNSPSKSRRSWSVYLIVSTNTPIKTYVGVTTDFSRRLKQHNGELKGGAKASCAGRPWICACLIHGFKDQSEACGLESKWKSLSRSLPRKRKNDNKVEQVKDLSLPLLQHRQAALNRVRGMMKHVSSDEANDRSLGELTGILKELAYTDLGFSKQHTGETKFVSFFEVDGQQTGASGF